MAKRFEGIDDHLRAWIAAQTRLLRRHRAARRRRARQRVAQGADRHAAACSTSSTIAYLDGVGSGAETIAHLRENGRIVVMLCAFSGPPRILRLHGTGTVHLPGTDGYERLLAACGFDDPSIPEGRRSIVRVDVTRVADSCGYGVPLMAYEGHARARAQVGREAAARARARRPADLRGRAQRREHRRAARAGRALA